MRGSCQKGSASPTSAKQAAPSAPTAFSQSVRVLASKLADRLGDAWVVALEPVALHENGLDRLAELGTLQTRGRTRREGTPHQAVGHRQPLVAQVGGAVARRAVDEGGGMALVEADATLAQCALGAGGVGGAVDLEQEAALAAGAKLLSGVLEQPAPDAGVALGDR